MKESDINTSGEEQEQGAETLHQDHDLAYD